MDEKLKAQMEEARAQGYTDEQIQEFLNPKPVERLDQKRDESGAPVSPFVDRGPEAVGTAQYGAAEAAKYAAIGGGGLYGAKKVAQALRPGPVAPAPTTFTGGANPAFDRALSQPAQQPGVMQRGMDIASKMRQIAAERVVAPAANAASAAAPYARAAGGVTAALMPGNAGQNYPFPQSGPMRGMEINPATGRPWTAQELQAYNSQPGMQ
jgi:hypothetical protein